MTSQECIQRKTDTDTEIALGFILTELRKGKWRIIIVEVRRYMNHIQSLKFENKLYAVVKEKMEEMQLQNMSWIEVSEIKMLTLV